MNFLSRMCPAQMWIYSLGITLRRTIQSSSGGSSHRRVTSSDAAQPSGPKDCGAPATANRRAPAAATQQRLHQRPSDGGAGGNGTRLARHNNYAEIGEHFSAGSEFATLPRNAYRHLTSLDYVIRTMCAPNIHYRASLMYLLDVS